ncbi:MAG: efflux transporter outer membrane subunit [Breznakibacter sp.]
MNNTKIKNSLILIAAVAALGLASCNSNKRYVSPEVDTNGLYRDVEGQSDTTNIGQIPWNEFFTDPVLQSLVREGLEKNINMQVAQLRIKQAEAGFLSAKAALFPTLSAATQLEHTQISTGQDGTKVLGYSAETSYMLGFAASWEVDLWGKLNSQKRAKYASLLNSYEYANLIQTSLIANIAKSYYTLLALDEQKRITIESIELYKSTTETMEALKEAGTQNAAGVEQTKSLLYSAQLAIPTLERQISETENALCILLNRKPGSVERRAIDAQAVPAELEHGVPAQMVANRPDVRQAELSFRVAFEATRTAKASMYPSLTLSSATVGFVPQDLADFFNPANIAANIVVGASQPLFYKRQLRSNLEIANAQQTEALLNFQNTVLTAGQEISNILYGFKRSMDKNQLREQQISSLTNAVDYTQQLLLAGEANYTEVLTAQRNLLSAQLSQVDDKLEQLTYNVSLYKALGGGVK